MSGRQGDGIGAGAVAARCPLRPGEPCTLCQLDVTGPQDCGLVYLVMSDPELREGLRQRTAPTIRRTDRSEPSAPDHV